jgi:hypothetical protein
MAPVDRAAWARETVHTYGGTRDGVRAQVRDVLTHLNSLKPKLIQIILNNSVRTAKKTPQFTITKINRLTLFITRII